jgi:flagellar biogenesis protein FliO
VCRRRGAGAGVGRFEPGDRRGTQLTAGRRGRPRGSHHLRTDPSRGLPTLADDGSAGLFGRMLAYLVVVAMLGAAAVFVAKRYFPRGKASLGRIRVLDSAYLAPRKQLHILEVGPQKFLVASTRDHVSMIAELRDSFGEAYERQKARADAGQAPAGPPDGEAP